MKNVSRLFQMFLAILLFCTGLVVMLQEAKTYHATLRNTRKLISEDVIYQQYQSENDQTLSYAELIATLMLPLDFDIMVDGTIIRKASHNIDKIDGYGLRNANYEKSYKYNETANIEMIIYTSLS